MTSSQPDLDAVAAGQLDDTDDRTLATIAELYHSLDPMPAGLVDQIAFAITLDALHAEVAELQRSADLVGARSDNATEAQTITFTSSSLTTMVTVTPQSADRVRVDGWAAPGAGLAVELRVAGEMFTTVADDDGRFVFADVPRGTARFLLRTADGDATAVVTPGIEL